HYLVRVACQSERGAFLGTVPEADGFIQTARCQARAGGVPGDGMHASQMANSRQQAAMALTVQVVPFPTTQVRTFVSPMGQLLTDPAQSVGDLRRLPGEVHLRQVQIVSQLPPLRRLSFLGRDCFLPFSFLFVGKVSFFPGQFSLLPLQRAEMCGRP